MRRPWLIGVITASAFVVALSTWVMAANRRGGLPPGDYSPAPDPVWLYDGSDAELMRRDALSRAVVRLDPPTAIPDQPPILLDRDARAATPPSCRFINEAPSGTTSKFHCVFAGGQVVKVKYGHNAEIHAEAAATRLLSLLGFPADTVTLVPRLRCYGCPRLPFETMYLLSLLPGKPTLDNDEDRYTDFDWVAVETKFPAPSIETPRSKGWAWWELKYSAGPRADVDALRLLAAFLGHWDNKADNQRLVCLDAAEPIPGEPCRRPLAMIQDLGATFGPHKVNLTRWRDTPVWTDPHTCTLGMQALPYAGATFPEVRISEEGRQLLARQLSALSDAAVRTLFADARFPQFYSATADKRDLDAWTQAFHARVMQIERAGPCT